MGGCVGKPKAEEGHGSPVVKAAARAQLAPQPLFARPLYAIILLCLCAPGNESNTNVAGIVASAALSSSVFAPSTCPKELLGGHLLLQFRVSEYYAIT